MVANLETYLHSKLSLMAKAFVWRVLTGGLPLWLTLKRCGIAIGNCLFCIFQIEDSTHCFRQSSIARKIGCISKIWQVLSHCYLSVHPSHWRFNMCHYLSGGDTIHENFIAISKRWGQAQHNDWTSIPILWALMLQCKSWSQHLKKW